MVATYTKGGSTDIWAFQGNMTVGGTLTTALGIVAPGNVTLGSITDASGLVLTDSVTKGIGLFTELPSTGAALSAGTVIEGMESRLAVNKDQGATDTSIYAFSGHLRVKANTASSSAFGIWAYLEESDTATIPFGGALRAKVEGDATLTATSLFGIHVDGHVASGATVTNFPAIKVATDIEGSSGQKAWTTILEVGTAPSVAYFKVPDDGTFASITNGNKLADISATANAGFITIVIGSTLRYIPVYAAKTS